MAKRQRRQAGRHRQRRGLRLHLCGPARPCTFRWHPDASRTGFEYDALTDPRRSMLPPGQCPRAAAPQIEELRVHPHRRARRLRFREGIVEGAECSREFPSWNGVRYDQPPMYGRIHLAKSKCRTRCGHQEAPISLVAVQEVDG